MKKSLFTLTVAALAAFWGCSSHKSGDENVLSGDSVSHIVRIDTMARIVSLVQQQSRLYTSECQIHKVVLFSDETRLGGKLLDIALPGERKVAIPIDVTLKGYIDFSDFSEGNVLLRDSLCVITLPDPKILITSSKIDHKGVRQYVGMTRSKFSDGEITRLSRQGEDSIASHLSNYGIVDRSRESCARTLVPILTKMGYAEDRVIIRFRKNFNDNEIKKLTLKG